MTIKSSTEIAEINKFDDFFPYLKGLRIITFLDDEYEQSKEQIWVCLFEGYCAISFFEQEDWEKAEKVMSENNIVFKKQAIDHTMDALFATGEEIFKLIELLKQEYKVSII